MTDYIKYSKIPSGKNNELILNPKNYIFNLKDKLIPNFVVDAIYPLKLLEL